MALVLPGPDEVHVWRLDLTALVSDAARLCSVLSIEERARAAGFLDRTRRLQFELTRARVRQLLAHYLEIDARDVVVAHGSDGKPRLNSPAALSFNVSHSGGLALCAFTGQTQIGVDLEAVRPVAGRDRVSQQLFARPDRAGWGLSRTSTRSFLEAWVAREAILKLHGDVTIARLSDSASGCREYYVRTLDIGPEYVASLATMLPVNRILMRSS